MWSEKDFTKVPLEVALHWLGIGQCAGGCLPLICAQKLAILTGSSLWFCPVTSIFWTAPQIRNGFLHGYNRASIISITLLSQLMHTT